MRRRRWRRWGLVAASAVILSACTTNTSGHGRPAALSGSGTAAPSASASGPGVSPPTHGSDVCPSTLAAPDPARPVVSLRFDVAADHASVQGHETVRFTPDLEITELVFRLTANTAPTFAAGNRVTVTSARADHGAGSATYSVAGADPRSQGGLLHIPFATAVPAGTTVTAELAFTVVLGEGAFDRFGRSGRFAWFGSAQPLLAWQRGYGWHTEPMLAITAESATSEAAQTDLTVSTPAADTVLASGLAEAGPVSGGRRVWTSTVASARDVSVAVGPFVIGDAEVDGVKVRVGAPDAGGLAEVMTDQTFAIEQLTRRFGPFPFPTLSVALLPIRGGGIEYPSSILLLGSYKLVTVHETAHQYFYAMIGNSQAAHPWLDEAFASYAEQLVDNDPAPADVIDTPGPVDATTESYGTDDGRYQLITYEKGSRALYDARAAAGGAAFDAAVRCYINANAWTIAEPVDVASALRDLPAALAVLRRAGAID